MVALVEGYIIIGLAYTNVVTLAVLWYYREEIIRLRQSNERLKDAVESELIGGAAKGVMGYLLSRWDPLKGGRMERTNDE